MRVCPVTSQLSLSLPKMPLLILWFNSYYHLHEYKSIINHLGKAVEIGESGLVVCVPVYLHNFSKH